jgi:hypothetical protein
MVSLQACQVCANYFERDNKSGRVKNLGAASKQFSRRVRRRQVRELQPKLRQL